MQRNRLNSLEPITSHQKSNVRPKVSIPDFVCLDSTDNLRQTQVSNLALNLEKNINENSFLALLLVILGGITL